MCTTAAKRGLGRPKRAAELRIADVAAAEDPVRSVDGGPMQSRECWLVAMWWLLREVELAGIRLHESHVELAPGRATLHLPMAKNDIGGAGRSRTLRCLCAIMKLPDGEVPGASVCPACTVHQQVARVERLTGHRAADEAAMGIPLFPNAGLQAPSKKSVVESWRTLQRCGARAQELVSGHSARRSGAKLLARCGWALWQIQFHGRWGSEVVKEYTEEVFAEVATSWSLQGPPPPPATGPSDGRVGRKRRPCCAAQAQTWWVRRSQKCG